MKHKFCDLTGFFHSTEFRIYLILLCLCLPVSAMAQNQISGKVSDEATGEPLIGVTVQVKETGKEPLRM